MPRLPRVTGRDLVRALERAGFEDARQRGSHHLMRKFLPDGTKVVFPVPVHEGKIVKLGTLKGILRLARMEAEDLERLLGR